MFLVPALHTPVNEFSSHVPVGNRPLYAVCFIPTYYLVYRAGPVEASARTVWTLGIVNWRICPQKRRGF